MSIKDIVWNYRECRDRAHFERTGEKPARWVAAEAFQWVKDTRNEYAMEYEALLHSVSQAPFTTHAEQMRLDELDDGLDALNALLRIMRTGRWV